jgi:hypothetical protein
MLGWGYVVVAVNAWVSRRFHDLEDGDMGYVRSHWRRGNWRRRGQYVRSHYRANPRRNDAIVVVGVVLVVLLVIAVLTAL